MTPKEALSQSNKVRWRCNRGMLELDLLLIPFAENHFSLLDEKEKATFIELLTYEDPTLFNWLMGQDVAEDKALNEMVIKIKQAIRLSH